MKQEKIEIILKELKGLTYKDALSVLRSVRDEIENKAIVD